MPTDACHNCEGDRFVEYDEHGNEALCPACKGTGRDLVKRARALCEAATPGPWLCSETLEGVETTQVAKNGDIYGGFLWQPDFDEHDSREARLNYLRRDGAFIAASRELVPALCARVEAAERERDEADLLHAVALARHVNEPFVSLAEHRAALAEANSKYETAKHLLVVCEREREDVRSLLDPEAPAAHYVCNECGRRMKTWREMEEYQHDSCGGLVELASVVEMRAQRDSALTRVSQLEKELAEWQGAGQQIVDLFDPMKARAEYGNFVALVAMAARDAHVQVRNDRDSLRAQLAACQAELETVRADAVLALALDQEQIDENAKESDRLLAALQRESARVNEAGGVQAHLVGVLHEVSRCTTLENAKTFALTALTNIEEKHAGLWQPGPSDDAADWKPGHHREPTDRERIERSTAEQIAAYSEECADDIFRGVHRFSAVDERDVAREDALRLLAADIRANAWKAGKP